MLENQTIACCDEKKKKRMGKTVEMRRELEYSRKVERIETRACEKFELKFSEASTTNEREEITNNSTASF